MFTTVYISCKAVNLFIRFYVITCVLCTLFWGCFSRQNTSLVTALPPDPFSRGVNVVAKSGRCDMCQRCIECTGWWSGVGLMLRYWKWAYYSNDRLLVQYIEVVTVVMSCHGFVSFWLLSSVTDVMTDIITGKYSSVCIDHSQCCCSRAS